MKILVNLPDELSDKIHARIKLSTAEVYDLLACIVNGTVVDGAEKGATNGNMIKAMFPSCEEIKDLYAEIKGLEEKIERYEKAFSSVIHELNEYMENYKLREANGWSDRFEDGIECAYDRVCTNWNTVEDEEDDDEVEEEENE